MTGKSGHNLQFVGNVQPSLKGRGDFKLHTGMESWQGVSRSRLACVADSVPVEGSFEIDKPKGSRQTGFEVQTMHRRAPVVLAPCIDSRLVGRSLASMLNPGRSTGNTMTLNVCFSNLGDDSNTQHVGFLPFVAFVFFSRSEHPPWGPFPKCDSAGQPPPLHFLMLLDSQTTHGKKQIHQP